MVSISTIYSMNAAGSLGELGEYTQSPDHWTIGKRPKETDPYLGDWRTMEAAMQAANTLWKSMTAEQQTAWTERARQLALPLRQAFLAANLYRAARYLPLSANP
jgi:hypothetical protein